MKLDGPVGGLDEACRLAQQMREELARRRLASSREAGTEQASLRLLKREGGPTRKQLERAGFFVVREDGESISLRIKFWQPRWLQGAREHPPGLHAFARVERRRTNSVLGDPAVARPDAIHLPTYKSIGLRAAVRSTLRCPPGGTLLVDLPTGAGKSRCAQALVRAHRRGLVAVAVPTTVLCIDQERALREFEPSIDHPTAFYSGGEQVRSKILKRLHEGTQRAIFASPEALNGVLSRVLHEVARRGEFVGLVLDEAHIVGQWGESFRPEFHWLAGVRRSLIAASPDQRQPRTILLTATVTPKCEQTLRDHFGEPGPFEIVRAGQLRPEPETWHCHCESSAKKRQRVLEAVINLPKPLILYATRRDTKVEIEQDPWDDRVKDDGDQPDGANQWYERLCGAGLSRVALVTGKTATDDRESIIRRFRDGEIDIVVGTSAFGLGVDQPNVRTVLHACLPETIDRYYQEVGRAGRDGQASVAMTLVDDAEEREARRMARQYLIGPEKGWRRWRRLWNERQSLDGCRVAVTLNRGGLSNDAHRLWDDRTLVLTAQAGLIQLDHDPDVGTGPESRDRRVISWRHEAVHDGQQWKARVVQARTRSVAVKRGGLESLQRLLSGDQCVAVELGSTYRPEGSHAGLARACGGCPACRRLKLEPYVDPVVTVEAPSWAAGEGLNKSLARRLGSDRSLFIHEAPEAWSGSSSLLPKILDWLVESGVTSVAAPSDVLESWWNRGGLRAAVGVALSKRVEDLPRGDPLAIVLKRDEPVDLEIFDHDRPALVVIAPNDAPQTGFPERRAIELARCGVEAAAVVLAEEMIV